MRVFAYIARRYNSAADNNNNNNNNNKTKLYSQILKKQTIYRFKNMKY